MQGHGHWVLRSPGVGRTGGSVWAWVVQDLLPDRQREDFICSDSFILYHHRYICENVVRCGSIY